MPPRPSHEKLDNHQSWSLLAATIIGALVGASASTASQVINAIDPLLTDLAPFLHILKELLLAAVIGASTFATVAAVRSRLLPKRSGSFESDHKLRETI
jgi:ABC-type antimicrobial peptide transport system permease subunit